MRLIGDEKERVNDSHEKHRLVGFERAYRQPYERMAQRRIDRGITSCHVVQ
jgi:hypothetical protein